MHATSGSDCSLSYLAESPDPGLRLLQGKAATRKRKRKSVPRGVMLLDPLRNWVSAVFYLIVQLLRLSRRKLAARRAVRYYRCPISPITEARLLSVKKKVMVLDLDETLIHSHHNGGFLNNHIRSSTYAAPFPDFVVRVTIENNPVCFYVYKRPHVDYFLTMVSQWYELVIFTASMQRYGMEVAKNLDANRGILQRRYFRQDCTVDMNGYTKDLKMVCPDLSRVFIIDNSPAAYRVNPDNAIPIKSWFSEADDTALLDLLPMLDALRFTQDVRSVLCRNLHNHTLF